MWLFVLVCRDLNYIKCNIDLTIKGDNPVNDTKLKLKLSDFRCDLFLIRDNFIYFKTKQTGLNNYRLYHLNSKRNCITNLCSLLLGVKHITKFQ